jgi:hypothetical protein
MSITAQMLGSIQLNDSVTGSSPFIKQFASLLVQGTSYSEAQSLSLPASLTALTLPISPVSFLYIKNLHAVNTILVTWTPTGGSTASIQTLEPGGWIIMGNPATGAGVTALSLTASGAATPCEYILAG